jgi:drug/metabolite transporter (DMT)-like permease
MYFMSRAYRLAQASVIAPFEYISLPINFMWGFVIWQEIPTWMTLAGAFLTLFSGIYVLYREQRERPEVEQPESKRGQLDESGWRRALRGLIPA